MSRRLKDTVAYAIHITRPDVANGNTGAQRLKIDEEAEIVGEHFSRLMKIARLDCRFGLSQSPLWKVGLRRRTGACAKTAPGSGPA
jgi:hypothetical protein